MRSKFQQAIMVVYLATGLQTAYGEKDSVSVMDSLTQRYNSALPDTSKVNLLLEMANTTYVSKPDTALVLCQKGLQLAKSIEFQRGISDAYAWLGYMYMVKGNDSLALSCFFQCRDLEIQLGNRERLANVLNNIGYAYKQKGEIENALEYYHQSLSIEEESGNERGVSYALNNLSVLYVSQGDQQAALECVKKSLDIRKRLGDKNGIAGCLNNMGTIQSKLGNADSSMKCYRAALVIDRELDNPYGVGHSLSSIGLTFKSQRQLDSALRYFQESMLYMTRASSRKGICAVGNFIADVYVGKRDYSRAAEYAGKSLQLAKDLGYPAEIANAAMVLKSIAVHEEKWDEALLFRELEVKMRDSLKNEETQKASIRQQTKYEFEKAQLIKEQEKKEQERRWAAAVGRRNNLQYSGIVIMLIVMLIGIHVTPTIGGVSRKIPQRFLEAIIFFMFLIFFEFLLVLADPYIERWSGGAPGIKLLFNAGVAALIFPLHSFFEDGLKTRLVKRT